MQALWALSEHLRYRAIGCTMWVRRNPTGGLSDPSVLPSRISRFHVGLGDDYCADCFADALKRRLPVREANIWQFWSGFWAGSPAPARTRAAFWKD